MRFFTVVDYQYMVLGFFLGVVCLILACMAWGSYPFRQKSKDSKGPVGPEEAEAGGEYESGVPPATPFLFLLYIGIAVWSVFYMIVVGVRGGSF